MISTGALRRIVACVAAGGILLAVESLTAQEEPLRLTVQLTPDQPKYELGDTISVECAVRNVGDHPCYVYASSYSPWRGARLDAKLDAAMEKGSGTNGTDGASTPGG